MSEHRPASERYVALWRGINVGKAKRLRMADLRQVLQNLGYSTVRTVLNSGNAVFDVSAPLDVAAPRQLAQRIEQAVADELEVDSRVTVLSAERFLTVVEQRPFDSEELASQIDEQPSRLLVFFYREESAAAALRPIAGEEWGDERIVVGERAAWCWLPQGQARSTLASALATAAGDGVTARNWSTVQRIAALLTS